MFENDLSTIIIRYYHFNLIEFYQRENILKSFLCQIYVTTPTNSLRELSSVSIISLTTALSCGSSVLASMSRKMRGTFIMCCTGATKRSVSCSFLQRGSRLHHCRGNTHELLSISNYMVMEN